MKTLVLAATAFCTGGCLIVPETPHYRDQLPSRENMDRPLEEKFPPPGASRERVLSRLGAPDEAWGESRLVYRWRKVVGEISTIGGHGSLMVKTYALEIEFDALGAVTRTRER